jgi:shikimate kinase
MPNVVLIGYRGSGKSTAGRILADRLGWPLVDTDKLVVERAGKSISAIFAEDGEAVFRDLEAEVIAEVARRENTIVSVGGGAVLRDANVRRLRACGTVFWLAADAETLWSHIESDPATSERRPALTDRPGLEEVRRLLQEREVHYAGCAHHRIDVAQRTAGEVADAIQSTLGPAA